MCVAVMISINVMMTSQQTVKNRLDVNIKLNTPLIDYYGQEKLLYNVDGDRDIDDVYKDIKKILDNL